MGFVNRGSLAIMVLILLSGVVFFYKLGDLAFIGADEARYAEVAREMLEQHDYVTPRLDYRPWFEKPPLYYWTTAAFFHMLGVSEFSARLGSAVLALAGVLFVFFFARRVFSPRAGFLSALILLTSGEYFVLGRAASTDLGLAVMLTMGFGCFYLGLVEPRPRGAYFALASYVLFGLAVLAKGPVGVLLPVLVILVYLTLTRQYRKVYDIQLLPGLLLFLLVVTPWHFLVIERHRFAFIASFFLNHNLARFFTRLHHHTQPAYYFLVVILIGFFPWSSFLPAILRRLATLRRGLDGTGRALLFLWVWVGVLTLFFSLSQSKLAGYILPVIPALAILVGKEWDDYLSGTAASARGMEICNYIYVGLAILMMVALPVFLRVRYDLRGPLPFLFSALYAASAVIAGLWIRRGARARLFYVIAGTPVLLIMLTARFLFPFIGAYHSVKEVSARAGQLTSIHQTVIAYQFEDYNLRYYSGFRPIRVAQNPFDLMALLRSQNGPLYCIALTKGVGELEGHPQFKATRVFERGNKILLRIQTP